MNFLRGIGPLEIFLIFVIIMVVFGVGKLPEVGEGLGRGIRMFKNSLAGKDEKEEDTKKTKK
jgi:sec-independent protein translocase protein TatA